MSRDPLEGIRSSDVERRPGLQPVRSGGGAIRIIALAVGVLVAAGVGAAVFLASKPRTPVGGTQVDTPASGATLTPLAVPNATPTMVPPPAPEPSAAAPSSHG